MHPRKDEGTEPHPRTVVDDDARTVADRDCPAHGSCEANGRTEGSDGRVRCVRHAGIGRRLRDRCRAVALLLGRESQSSRGGLEPLGNICHRPAQRACDEWRWRSRDAPPSAHATQRVLRPRAVTFSMIFLRGATTNRSWIPSRDLRSPGLFQAGRGWPWPSADSPTTTTSS